VPGSSQTPHFQFHQLLGCETDHLAQQIGAGAIPSIERSVTISLIIVVTLGEVLLW